MSKTPFLTSTAVAGLLAAPSAFAADLPPVLKAPPAVPPFASWAGGYVGVNVGYAWANDPSVRCTFTAPSPCTEALPALNPKGGNGGLLAGYNWQAGSWVLGLEGDFSALNVRDHHSFPSFDPGKTDQLTSRYDWLGTVRGRAGYSTGQMLFYGTGGLAFGHVRNSYVYALGDSNQTEFSRSETRTGWTAGAGAELALNTNVSLKVEYLYVQLQKSNLDVSSLFYSGGSIGPTVFHFNNNLNMVRAGVNFRF